MSEKLNNFVRFICDAVILLCGVVVIGGSFAALLWTLALLLFR